MRNLTLMTDLYQLTMMQSYFDNGMKDRAVFDMFFRAKKNIEYAVFAGLEQVVEYIRNIHFDEEDIAYLRSTKNFSEPFLDSLRNFRFTGNLYSVREGTFVFPDEPIVTVEAPLPEAQFVETALLNMINHQTLIATKASRVMTAAEHGVMEFGLRRAQGPDAGIYGARAAIIGGLESTSNVLAGQMFEVPVSGTHAHSYVMSFPDELSAFRAYAKSYPDNCLLLLDTYDTLKSGLPNALKVFDELAASGHRPRGVRMDSGDLAYLSKKIRKVLDDHGYPDAKICASGDLDEYSIRSLLSQGAKIDIWGVGTKLITSEDVPSLGGVYKLSAVKKGETYEPRIKISENIVKITNPGFKKLVRIYDRENMAQADLIMLREEEIDASKPLTIFHPVETWKKTTFTDYRVENLHEQVIRDGELVKPLPSFSETVAHAKAEKASFYEEYKRLDNQQIYKVDLSQGLYEVKRGLIDKYHNN